MLGHYYADKIRAACALALFDHSGDTAEQASAIRHLESALAHWKEYARLRDARYVPALYNRVGRVDVTALTQQVAADLDLAREWKPGTVKGVGAKAGTEKGFKK
ncbi:MAG: hypothetical protein O2960_22695 [Verrucomicrobia bacterium]|nr:hypothetical protein [Verrucomicrobiota bacterium]